MIPKKIHYCWFGGNPLNEMGEKCLASWKKFFPDYEIIEWNESNFDVHCCKYVEEAYEAKKWAFVSDYARFKILYEQGGVYFDTDVEVIKSFEDILTAGSFLGCENSIIDEKSKLAVAPGLGLAVEAGNQFVKDMLDEYHQSSFVKEDGSLDLYTIVERTTDYLEKHGLEQINEIQTVAGMTIYPVDYFCPIDIKTNKLIITDNTRSIHFYAGSWVDDYSKVRGKIYRFINRCLGKKFADKVRSIVGRK